MIRYVKFAALFAVIISIQTACASNASGAGGSGVPDFSDVRDKTWKLMEVHAGKNNVIFQRSMLTEEKFKDIYTIRFDAERVNGTGCPNRYFAPYTLGENQAININQMAATLMLAMFEPEQLKESEYFAYLEKADKWDIVKGNLELRSTNNESAVVFLVFSLTD